MKLKPTTILIILGFILVFIVGTRYGQKVEKTNKVVDYLLSIPPTKAPTPTIPLEFKIYSHKGCAIKLLIPTTLSVKEESTTSALFIEKNNESLEISCDKQTKMLEILNDSDIATGEVMFKNKKINIRITNNESTYLFKTTNPKNGQILYVAVMKSLFPLFENSLQFNP